MRQLIVLDQIVAETIWSTKFVNPTTICWVNWRNIESISSKITCKNIGNIMVGRSKKVGRHLYNLWMFPYHRWWIKCNVYRKNSRWNIVVVASASTQYVLNNMDWVLRFQLTIDKIWTSYFFIIKYITLNSFFFIAVLKWVETEKNKCC